MGLGDALPLVRFQTGLRPLQPRNTPPRHTSIPSVSHSELSLDSTTPASAKLGQVEERPFGPGDFVGYQGGSGASRYGHRVRAGEGGMELLIGGTRDGVDVCVYPT